MNQLFDTGNVVRRPHLPSIPVDRLPGPQRQVSEQHRLRKRYGVLKVGCGRHAVLTRPYPIAAVAIAARGELSPRFD